MTESERQKWNTRPTYTRTLEICPQCETLQENVKTRTVYGAWGIRHEKTCCDKCVAAVKEECLGVTIC